MYEQMVIDAPAFARDEKVARGKIAAADLHQLQEILGASGTFIHYVLSGETGRHGELFLRLVVEGHLRLRCQRCLGNFDFPLTLKSTLELVASDRREPAAVTTDELENIDPIPADKEITVLSLIEEEMLLALPFAPRHAPGACTAPSAFASPGMDHPMSALTVLKGKG